jgi:ComF family protein
MGAAMARLRLPDVAAGEPRIVVPMPTTPARIRSRGYNQALLLATDFASRRSLEVVEGLERTMGGASQTTLSPAARHGNVAGAFQPAASTFRRVEGMHVVLVDDVLTTGATASEAAKVLAGLGAASVSVATFARAMPTAS